MAVPIHIRILKWMHPGMKVKRWILLCTMGIIMVGIGSVKALSKEGIGMTVLGCLILIYGVALIILGMKMMVKSFLTVFLPEREKEIVNILYERRHLSKGPKIVALGGGTGLSVLLHGIKEYTSNTTAIVTVTDDGGSSGRLREEFDILPPGDIRNCLVALADAEPLMRDLFQFRFDEGSVLKGHNFGNLFITALSRVTGDFERAIKESSKVLAIRGQVIPSTLVKVVLVAEHKDSSETIGETMISRSALPIERIYLRPENPIPIEDALAAIRDSDVIIMGPGSLYTSVLPNLLVSGIKESILKSNALKVYICNVMTQSGETDNYKASDHVKAIIKHTSPGIINYCIVNTGHVPDEFIEKYRKENSSPVIADTQDIRDMGYSVIEEDVVNTIDYVRHNPEKLARIVMNLLEGKEAVYKR